MCVQILFFCAFWYRRRPESSDGEPFQADFCVFYHFPRLAACRRRLFLPKITSLHQKLFSGLKKRRFFFGHSLPFLAFLKQKQTFGHLSAHPPIGLSPISIPSSSNSINFFSTPLFYMAEPSISILGLCPPYRILTTPYSLKIGPHALRPGGAAHLVIPEKQQRFPYRDKF